VVRGEPRCHGKGFLSNRYFEHREQNMIIMRKQDFEDTLAGYAARKFHCGMSKKTKDMAVSKLSVRANSRKHDYLIPDFP